jgi:hypothetical protein
VKDNLIGRTVGWLVPHRLHPSQVEEGEPLDTTTTRWGQVTARVYDLPVADPVPTGEVMVRPIHGKQAEFGIGVVDVVPIASLHTIMPESYR